MKPDLEKCGEKKERKEKGCRRVAASDAIIAIEYRVV
jgi:hypothetical protein